MNYITILLLLRIIDPYYSFTTLYVLRHMEFGKMISRYRRYAVSAPLVPIPMTLKYRDVDAAPIGGYHCQAHISGGYPKMFSTYTSDIKAITVL